MVMFSELFCGCYAPQRSAGNPTTIGKIQPGYAHEEAVGGSSSALISLSMPGSKYEADASDAIDAQLSLQLAALERGVAARFMVRRLGPGDYEIDGRRVSLRLAASAGGLNGSGSSTEVVVCECSSARSQEEDGLSETPLPEYLRQVTSVSALLAGRTAGSSAVIRVPADQRLTFASVPGSREDSDPNGDRMRSMRVACEQARLREQAAEAFERGYSGANGLLPQAQPLVKSTLATRPPPGLPHGAILGQVPVLERGRSPASAASRAGMREVSGGASTRASSAGSFAGRKMPDVALLPGSRGVVPNSSQQLRTSVLPRPGSAGPVLPHSVMVLDQRRPSVDRRRIS